jgi:hypothetical protein
MHRRRAAAASVSCDLAAPRLTALLPFFFATAIVTAARLWPIALPER